MGQERAPSFLPTLVKFELRLVQLFGLWIEVDVRRPWLLHVLEHSGLSVCRTSLSATTLGVTADTSALGRDAFRSVLAEHRGHGPLLQGRGVGSVGAPLGAMFSGRWWKSIAGMARSYKGEGRGLQELARSSI